MARGTWHVALAPVRHERLLPLALVAAQQVQAPLQHVQRGVDGARLRHARAGVARGARALAARQVAQPDARRADLAILHDKQIHIYIWGSALLISVGD